jgi:hypothetical protein
LAAKISIERGYDRGLPDEEALKKFTEMVEESGVTAFPVTFFMIHESIDGKEADPHIRAVIATDATKAAVTLDVDIELFNLMPEFDTETGKYVGEEALSMTTKEPPHPLGAVTDKVKQADLGEKLKDVVEKISKPEPTIEEKLAELQDLRDRGIITDEELAHGRKSIIFQG